MNCAKAPRCERSSEVTGSAGYDDRVIHLSRRGFVASLMQATKRPNILLILADDLGIGDLSCYGGTDVRTPHLDALAKSGMRFTNFYANCTVCSPTRASLMTGCYPDRVGVPGVIRTMPANSWGYLSPRATLLPQMLKPAGYDSTIVGKWHLGLSAPNTPTERGFDHFRGFLGDMMDDYETHRRHGNNYMRRDRQEIDPKGHATDLFTDWTIETIDQKKQFFIYLAYNAPHTPIQPPADWLKKVRARQPEMTEKRAKLVALVEHMDDGIGRIMARLKANGQMENTVVVFTSDNGGQLDAGGTAGTWRGGKQDMYEGGLRVPMMVSWPGTVSSGTTSEAIGLTMDLYSTLGAIAGVKAPADVDGLSLLPVWRGETAETPARDLVWMRREGGGPYQGRDYYAFRRGDWKLLQNTPFEPYRLYNLREDPREEQDRAAQEPARVRELSAALSRHIQRAASTPWQP